MPRTVVEAVVMEMRKERRESDCLCSRLFNVPAGFVPSSCPATSRPSWVS